MCAAVSLDEQVDYELDLNVINEHIDCPGKGVNNMSYQAIREFVWVSHYGNNYYGECYVCNKKISIFGYECCHIIPNCCNGLKTPDNLVPGCSNCNKKMYTTNLFTYMFMKHNIRFLTLWNQASPQSKLRKLYDERGNILTSKCEIISETIDSAMPFGKYMNRSLKEILLSADGKEYIFNLFENHNENSYHKILNMRYEWIKKIYDKYMLGSITVKDRIGNISMKVKEVRDNIIYTDVNIKVHISDTKLKDWNLVNVKSGDTIQIVEPYTISENNDINIEYIPHIIVSRDSECIIQCLSRALYRCWYSKLTEIPMSDITWDRAATVKYEELLVTLNTETILNKFPNIKAIEDKTNVADFLSILFSHHEYDRLIDIIFPVKDFERRGKFIRNEWNNIENRQLRLLGLSSGEIAKFEKSGMSPKQLYLQLLNCPYMLCERGLSMNTCNKVDIITRRSANIYDIPIATIVTFILDKIVRRKRFMCINDSDTSLQKIMEDVKFNIDYYKYARDFGLIPMTFNVSGKNITFIYLKRQEKSELQAANYLKQISLVRLSPRASLDVINDVIQKRKLDEYQAHAVRNSLNNNIYNIIGEPGTGKSEVIKALVDISHQCRIKTVILSFTGKIISFLKDRVKSIIGEDNDIITIKTIDKFIMDEYARRRNPETFKSDDTTIQIIMDEASMTSVELFVRLIKVFNNNTKISIIFIGDNNQLPPINSGCFFSELCKSGVVPITELKKNHRVNAEHGSGIIIENLNIIKNHQYGSVQLKEGNMFKIKHDITNEDQLIDYFIELSTKNPDKNCVILCPYGEKTTRVLSERIQEFKLPQAEEKIYDCSGYNKTFRIGAEIVFNISDTDNNICNGGLGRIDSFDGYEAINCYCNFAGRIVRVPRKANKKFIWDDDSNVRISPNKLNEDDILSIKIHPRLLPDAYTSNSSIDVIPPIGAPPSYDSIQKTEIPLITDDDGNYSGKIIKINIDDIIVKFGTNIFKTIPLKGIKENNKQYSKNKKSITIADIGLAWVISVTKSQGLEFDFVIYYVPNNYITKKNEIMKSCASSEFLNKNTSYTAISRAKVGCLLVGNIKAILESIGYKVNREENLRLRIYNDTIQSDCTTLPTVSQSVILHEPKKRTICKKCNKDAGFYPQGGLCEQCRTNVIPGICKDCGNETKSEKTYVVRCRSCYTRWKNSSK